MAIIKKTKLIKKICIKNKKSIKKTYTISVTVAFNLAFACYFRKYILFYRSLLKVSTRM